MQETIVLFSEDQKSKVTIQKGELTSYDFDGVEIMHQKGSPGWGSTDIEMFPIIGATKDHDYKVLTPKGDAYLDQHGILRTLAYELDFNSNTKASLTKKYEANTISKNPKYPLKSALENLSWPYDFEFTKTIEVSNTGIQIRFEVRTNKEMPYMLGYHPAFKIYNQDVVLETNSDTISLDQILTAGADALFVEKGKQIHVKNNGTYALKIETKGFKHLMLWSEVQNMICIEPITFYPPSVAVKELHTGFDWCEGSKKFEVTIVPIKN